MSSVTLIPVIISILVFFILLLVTAVKPKHNKLSYFELERRASLGDDTAKKYLLRERLLIDVFSLRLILISLLQVLIWLFLSVAFGIVIAIILAILTALSIGFISNLSIVQKLSNGIYNRYENSILSFIKNHLNIFRLFRSYSKDDFNHNLFINSKEEMQHLITKSENVLSEQEKKFLIANLSFNDKLVSSVMTPRRKLKLINKSEFLGPLTLDSLHKIGHSRLPVMNGDIDKIIGILHLDKLLSLDNKRSVTAEKAMDNKVFYIREDQTLTQALSAFLHTQSLLFIVINKECKTKGLITIDDIIHSFMGYELIDDFEQHSNIKAVASRDIGVIKDTKNNFIE